MHRVGVVYMQRRAVSGFVTLHIIYVDSEMENANEANTQMQEFIFIF